MTTTPTNWPQNVAPYYRPILFAGVAASAGVVLGSIGTWVRVLVFSVDGLSFDNWGVATLTLGATSGIAMSILLFWATTPFEPRWAVPVVWVVFVAGVACLTSALINIVRLLMIPKEDFFGVRIGPSVGWGLWLLGISSTLLSVTAGIGATQIAKNIDDSPRWVSGWAGAALIATLAIAISGLTYIAAGNRLTGDDIASESRPTAPATGPFATMTAPPSTTTPYFTPPAPSDFTIDVYIIEKSCFASYGCNVRFKIEPHYIGTDPIPDSAVFTVVYEVAGCEDEKQASFEATSTRWDPGGIGWDFCQSPSGQLSARPIQVLQ